MSLYTHFLRRAPVNVQSLLNYSLCCKIFVECIVLLFGVWFVKALGCDSRRKLCSLVMDI